MSVSAASSATSNASSSAATTTASSISGLSQSDFYTIITTELENQNPDDATDTNQMVEQMMELSNYEATQLNSQSITNLSNYSTSTSLLGKTVDIDVPASSVTAAQTVTGVVTSAVFGASVASVLVNGTAYPLSEVADAYANTSSTTNSNGTTSGN